MCRDVTSQFTEFCRRPLALSRRVDVGNASDGSQFLVMPNNSWFQKTSRVTISRNGHFSKCCSGSLVKYRLSRHKENGVHLNSLFVLRRGGGANHSVSPK